MNDKPKTTDEAHAGQTLAAAHGSACKVRIWYDGTWNNDELRRLAAGERIDRNGKRYGIRDAVRRLRVIQQNCA